MGNKSARTEVLLGCRVLEFQQYIQNLRNDTTGSIHLDHIRPCSSFDLSVPAEQRVCFHYLNLQPLLPEQNWSKGAKWRVSDQVAWTRRWDELHGRPFEEVLEVVQQKLNFGDALWYWR